MNSMLVRIVAILLGAVVFVIQFLLGPAGLQLMSKFFPEATTPEDMSWRFAVNVLHVVESFIIFGIAGWIIGRLWPSEGWKWALWLAIFPALAELLLLIFVGIKYPLTLVAGFVALIAGGMTGAHLGSRARPELVQQQALGK